MNIVKLRVEDQEHSARVQTILFALGFRWSRGKGHYQINDGHYICLDAERLCCSSQVHSDETLLTTDEFLKHAIDLKTVKKLMAGDNEVEITDGIVKIGCQGFSKTEIEAGIRLIEHNVKLEGKEFFHEDVGYVNLDQLKAINEAL